MIHNPKVSTKCGGVRPLYNQTTVNRQVKYLRCSPTSATERDVAP